MGHPVFSHQPIHILVPSGNRPGDSACGIPGFFCRLEDVLHLDGVAEPQPVVILVGGGKGKVTGDTVLSHIASGHHGHMGRISHRGIYGTHTSRDLTASRQKFLKIRQPPQGVYVLTYHSVYGVD